MSWTLFLFLVIIIEGYVVLSTELLAIRQTLPYVGNGTDTVSIIIAAVLMPLAFGYYYGGRYKPGRKNGRYVSVRAKLANNIIIAALFLLPALSYLPLSLFFYGLSENGINHRIVTTALYALIFIVTPVYRLGQTIPLVSNYFSSEKLSQITGKMLFFSTMGSFLGAVFSTLVLMSFFGVHITVCVVFALLALLVFLIEKKKITEKPLLMLAIAVSAYLMNSPAMMRNLHIIGDNQYNTAIIAAGENGAKHFILNGNSSSMLLPDGSRGGYIAFIEEHYIDPIMTGSTPPKSILVIGAGGFTLGLDDDKNDYTYVDIDPQLKDLSERYFIRKKLGKNKHFVPEDARAWLNHAGRKFDFVLVDVFFGDVTIPEYLVTREFFQQIRAVVNDNGIVTWNFILSPGFKGRMSQNLDNTLHSVFPHLDRQVITSIGKPFNGWDRDENSRRNIIYSWYNTPDDSIHTIYTDDKNAVFFDKPERRH
jgi:predicted membrane-bound spermidine synthase